jgi:uncharacterized phage-associated protein
MRAVTGRFDSILKAVRRNPFHLLTRYVSSDGSRKGHRNGKGTTVPISADLAADRLIQEMVKAGKPLDNLKLQKMLYYAQGLALHYYSEPLLTEDFQAWAHGPAIPRLYGRFKAFGWQPFGIEAVGQPDAALGLAQQNVRVIRQVVEQLGDLDGTALERRTHREPPWVRARAGLPDDAASSNVIRKEWIKGYFDSLAA